MNVEMSNSLGEKEPVLASLVKDEDGAWRLDLLVTQTESKSLLGQMLDQFGEWRDHGHVLILSSCSMSHGSDKLSISFRVLEGPDIAITEEVAQKLKLFGESEKLQR